MSDNYQAVYDAVKSSMPNMNQLCSDIVAQFDFSHQAEIIKEDLLNIVSEQTRPSVLYRPSIQRDGNQWCALYGADLHDGVAGFGDSPAEAMAEFDNEWRKYIQEKGG